MLGFHLKGKENGGDDHGKMRDGTMVDLIARSLLGHSSDFMRTFKERGTLHKITMGLFRGKNPNL